MATFEIAINGSKVHAGQDISPVSVDVRYGQPRRFSFTAPRAFPVALNSTIQLKVNGTLRFDGTVMTRNPDPNAANAIAYTAVDYTDQARDVQVNLPRIGADADKLNAAFYYAPARQLSDILKLAESVFGAELRAVRAAPDSGSTFSGITSGVIPLFSVQSGGFPDFMDSALSGIPGLQWLWIPATKQWHIVNVFSAPTHTLTVDAQVIEQNPLSQSIEGRYTKVTLIGQPETVPIPKATPLVNAWNPNLEENWSVEAVTGQAEADAEYDPEREYVFRRFSFAEVLGDTHIDRDQPVDLRQRIKIKSKGGDEYHWVSVEVQDVDFDNGFITARAPCIEGVEYDRADLPAPFQDGVAQPPEAMQMRFIERVETPANVVSVGYDGTAYTAYGLKRILVRVEDENSEVNVQRAQMLLDAYKDVLITGAVPVAGDPLDWAWDLNARVNVRAPGITTGAENMRAILSGYTYEFGDGGKNTLSLGTDVSPFIGTSSL